ncbi:hypothetical protein KIW84_033856 [Lathyrus oleraceus]|uniref:DUF7745 domain-containing protein n=1 Tax=Pisum sativum TaxID=3888 RepID=A0A9D4XZP8_PEA|nr:hypothetical protein KIW84_033856 [Pisum sativum]
MAPMLEEFAHILHMLVKDQVPYMNGDCFQESIMVAQDLRLEKELVDSNLRTKSNVKRFPSSFFWRIPHYLLIMEVGYPLKKKPNDRQLEDFLVAKGVEGFKMVNKICRTWGKIHRIGKKDLGEHDDRKNNSIVTFSTLGSRSISWSFKKHSIVTSSTLGYEFVSLASCACHDIWLRRIQTN